MTTKTDIEQERAEFEAWYEQEYGQSLGEFSSHGFYLNAEEQLLWKGYQAGRAALQSQDLEDAQEVAATLATVLHFIPRSEEPELYDDVERLCAEFSDHARRIEGEGE